MTEGRTEASGEGARREGSWLPEILEDAGLGSRVSEERAAQVTCQHLLVRNKETNLLLSKLEQK